MKYDEFLARVRERGAYSTNDEAELVCRAVLSALGNRLAGGEIKDLASPLPNELAGALLRQPQAGQAQSVNEFLQQVGDRLGVDTETAQWATIAVLTTVAGSIEGGQLNHLLSQLPSSYASLFGHPELA